MSKNKEMKSGIIGQAQVIFGGAVSVGLGTIGDRKGAFAIGLSEFIHPAKKAGDIPPSQDTYGVQVGLVFPDLETLRNFRGILNELEAGLKDRIKKSEVQQVDSLPKED